MTYLKTNKQLEIENSKTFRQEIKDICAIIAFGGRVYSILTRNLANEFKIIKIPHYSNWDPQEKYRDIVYNILQCT